MPSDNTTFMLVLGAIILLTLFYLFSGPAIPNEGPLQIKNQNGK